MAITSVFATTEPDDSADTGSGGWEVDRNHGETAQPGTPVFVGYARVSTVDQVVHRQVDALRDAGCARIFVDEGVSGTRMDRPQLVAAIDYVRPGDSLTVLSLDRLGRNTKGVLDLVDDLQARNVGLRVLQLGLDTTTPSGRMVLIVLLAVAQLERDYLSERTRQGLVAARRRGRVGGRPKAMSSAQVRAAQAMRADGASLAECADAFGVSVRTIGRRVAQ